MLIKPQVISHHHHTNTMGVQQSSILGKQIDLQGLYGNAAVPPPLLSGGTNAAMSGAINQMGPTSVV